MNPAPDPEAAWLAAMAQGDHAALEALVQAWTPRFFAFSLRLLRDRAWAEEAVQDAFFKAWTKAGRYDPRLGRGSSWLFSVLHRTCLDRLRRERARGSRVTVAAEQAPEAAAREALDPVLALRLERALLALNPAQREAFELSYFQGCTHEEIAERLGQPLGTVKTRLRDGLLKLQKAFQAGASKAPGGALSDRKGAQP